MKKGFTLIELLVVIAIIATILGVALPNFLGARERARDTKRKAEINQLKSALRLYYNDYQSYPLNFNGGTGKLNYIQGCGAAGDGNCPCSALVDFAAGGAGCDFIYMKKFPSELGSSMFYYEVPSDVGDDFCLKVPLDNASDSDIAASQARCGVGIPGGACYQLASGPDYAVCAD
jgi:general secretion pathway protein G